MVRRFFSVIAPFSYDKIQPQRQRHRTTRGKEVWPMKKRCTNSSCRKEFRVEIFTTACPHCGKKYPRATGSCIPVNKSKRARWSVVTIKCSTSRNPAIPNVHAVKCLRRLSGVNLETNSPRMGLRNAVEVLRNFPGLAASGLSYAEAQRWVKELSTVGAVARAVPTRKCINGVYVYQPETDNSGNSPKAGK